MVMTAELKRTLACGKRRCRLLFLFRKDGIYSFRSQLSSLRPGTAHAVGPNLESAQHRAG